MRGLRGVRGHRDAPLVTVCSQYPPFLYSHVLNEDHSRVPPSLALPGEGSFCADGDVSQDRPEEGRNQDWQAARTLFDRDIITKNDL